MLGCPGMVTRLSDKMFYDAFLLCCNSRGSKVSFNICVRTDDDVEWFLQTIIYTAQKYGNVPIYSYDTDIGKSAQWNTAAFLVTFLSGSTITVGTADYWCRIKGNNWEKGEGLYTLIDVYEMPRFKRFMSEVNFPFTTTTTKDKADTVDAEAFDSYINDLMTGRR